MGFQKCACRRWRYALKSGSWLVLFCSLSLWKGWDLESWRCSWSNRTSDWGVLGFLCSQAGYPITITPPPPSFFLSPPTWTLPFSITYQYTSFGHSLSSRERTCLTLCFHWRSVLLFHLFNKSTWQEARLASKLLLSYLKMSLHAHLCCPLWFMPLLTLCFDACSLSWSVLIVVSPYDSYSTQEKNHIQYVYDEHFWSFDYYQMCQGFCYLFPKRKCEILV